MKLVFCLLFYICNVNGEETATWDPTIPNHGKPIQKSQEYESGEEMTFLALDRAIQWTMSQRNEDYGWGPDTPHTVFAVSLAKPNWFTRESLESKLVIKQFELELILRLWKHKEMQIKKGHLALNVLALVSLCRDPRSFYSKDLVAMVDHSVGEVDFEQAFSYLATCVSGKRLRKHQLRELIDMMNDESRIHSVDTLSVVLLCLRCSQIQGRHSLGPFISQGLSILTKQQAQDGSFSSNLHSTAVALQAMIANDMSIAWNATKAQEYIMSHQRKDGSFGNIFDTNAVLPVLSGNTMLKAQEMPCRSKQIDKDPLVNEDDAIESVPISPVYEGTTLPPLVSTEQPKIVNFTYIIWVGNSASIRHNMTFSVPENTTFFSIMQMAAEQDSHFEFTASKWANGYYIHTLSGQKEKQHGFWFWLLYRLPEPPVPGTKPSNDFVVAEGVVELKPKDGDYILFWYHQI